jgi:hypothetical protein
LHFFTFNRRQVKYTFTYHVLCLIHKLYFSDPLHPFNHRAIERYDDDDAEEVEEEEEEELYDVEFTTKCLKLNSKHIFTLVVSAMTSGGSWGVARDIWKTLTIRANSADHIASKLEIPGFTGDLLFRYVLAYLQPTLENNGSTPLKHQIDKLKGEGVIPVRPQQHLWYDAWKYNEMISQFKVKEYEIVES